ncbi:Tfp pilus assembly protein PilX [Fontibacillus solani]|uniref:Tfp pilus assembly protein PilX n=1 Tax=Fontibacillus solani TaxID=1572857 RepID=A0A7W3SQJ0_9BACL|nr:type II secretion system protein [Fontibacillus solani]MBA9084233.1 Tfp pilus assembly protein PilX [Fontibacillus solani]
MIRNERGYALVLVMFMIVIFLILATAVMSAALGGANRTEKAEDNVQSLHLAEKTLDEAVAYLVAQYDGKAMRPEDLANDMLQSEVDQLKDKITNTRLNVAEGKIISIVPLELASDHTSYSVKLTAEATVNNTKRTLQQEVIISSYPEFLNYAFGSEKDVIINGAVYSPKGSVYAGNELKIDNWADYKYFTIDKWIKAAYPRLDLKDDNKVFVQSLDAIKVHNLTGVTPRGREEGDYTSYLRSSNPLIEDLLGISKNQIQIRSNKKFVSINVEETFIDKATEATGIDTARSEIKNAIDSGNYTAFSDKLVSYGVTKMTAPPVKPTPPLDLNDTNAMNEYLSKKADYDNYIAQFKNITGSKLFDDDLELDGIEYKALEFTNNAQQGINGSSVKWFVVNGDLNIMNYNPDPDEKLTIKGNILVNGDVTISGNVMVDATIYTLGKTTLQDAIIRGMGPVNDRKQLMMISKGKIFINRVDAPSNHGSYSSSNANTLDAFFYTDDTAELYGVGSIFWLNGGFFSKETLTINAVRGDVEDTGSDFNFHITEDEKESRFVIEYNDQFKKQLSALPRIEKLSVQVKSRRLIPN